MIFRPFSRRILGQALAQLDAAIRRYASDTRHPDPAALRSAIDLEAEIRRHHAYLRRWELSLWALMAVEILAAFLIIWLGDGYLAHIARGR